MKTRTWIFSLILIFSGFSIKAQDLMDMFADNDSARTEYTYASFKATRLINGQTIELPPQGALNFVISHHFGAINSGAYEFFGLDQANIRFGLDYGINRWLSVGIGRSSVRKTYDGSVKVKLLRQSKGARNMPVTLTLFANTAITSLHWEDEERTNYFSSRMEFAYQLLLARKFGTRLSLQLMPTLIHRNLVETIEDQNDVWSIGAGGRFKVSNRVAVTGEYYYLLPGETADDYNNVFSIGVDLETGGHVFQLFLTNTQGLIEEQFIPMTDGNWMDGDIFISFNINRTFQIVK
jgi:opacity protein-like surface antigen